MQSYDISGGDYLVEVANSWMELCRVLKGLLKVCQKSEENNKGFARGMARHHTAVIEHHMAGTAQKQAEAQGRIVASTTI
jgi:hypothetical protein